MLGVSLDYHSDWAGWLVFEAIFAIIFVAEIIIKTVAACQTNSIDFQLVMLGTDVRCVEV